MYIHSMTTISAFNELAQSQLKQMMVDSMNTVVDSKIKEITTVQTL